MKTITIHLDEEEYGTMKDRKGALSWRAFFLLNETGIKEEFKLIEKRARKYIREQQESK